MSARRISRREFLRTAGGLGAGAAAAGVLNACGVTPSGEPTPTAAPGASPQPTAAPVISPTRRDLILGIAADSKTLGFTIKPGSPGSLVRNQISPKMLYTNYETNLLEPELLVEWAEETPTTWVAKLREGVQWQRGYGEVTAEDVAYTINYIKENKAYKWDSAHQFTAGAKARSKYVVEFNLLQPFGPFAGICLDDGGMVACKAAHLEMGDEEYSRNPVGFGPYQLKEWVSGSHFILERFPEYWREGQPILDELIFRIISDPSTSLASLETGEIDLTFNLLSQDYARILGNPELMLDSVPGWNWLALGFGFAPLFAPEYVPPDHPSQIMEVRQAISYAIDRKAIVDAVYNGYGQPGDNPLMEGFLGFQKYNLMYPETADLPRAQALMQSAGVDGFELKVMVNSDSHGLVRTVEVIAEQVAKIGVQVIIDPVDVSTWTDLWRNNKFQAGYTNTNFIAADSDAPIFAFNRSGANHQKGWPNGEVDAWLDRERAISDPIERAEIFQMVVRKAVIECPYIYTCHINLTKAQNAKLAGVPMTRVDHHIELREAHWTA